jgi:hypothetical protein
MGSRDMSVSDNFALRRASASFAIPVNSHDRYRYMRVHDLLGTYQIVVRSESLDDVSTTMCLWAPVACHGIPHCAQTLSQARDSQAPLSELQASRASQTLTPPLPSHNMHMHRQQLEGNSCTTLCPCAWCRRAPGLVPAKWEAVPTSAS